MGLKDQVNAKRITNFGDQFNANTPSNGEERIMEFIPINISKHKDYVIPFRKDSFIVSFGTDKDSGDENKYLDWLKQQIEKKTKGFALVEQTYYKNRTSIYLGFPLFISKSTLYFNRAKRILKLL